jgi:hypothetical protein
LDINDLQIKIEHLKKIVKKHRHFDQKSIRIKRKVGHKWSTNKIGASQKIGPKNRHVDLSLIWRINILSYLLEILEKKIVFLVRKHSKKVIFEELSFLKFLSEKNVFAAILDSSAIFNFWAWKHSLHFFSMSKSLRKCKSIVFYSKRFL